MAESVEVLITASVVPHYAHPGDAGADLHSAESLTLAPGERALVGTGVSIALPHGFAAFVVPRSGQIKVALLNTDTSAPFEIAAGDRIAQLIIMPVTRANFIPVETLPGSARGEGGFGSTGTSPIAGTPTSGGIA